MALHGKTKPDLTGGGAAKAVDVLSVPDAAVRCITACPPRGLTTSPIYATYAPFPRTGSVNDLSLYSISHCSRWCTPHTFSQAPYGAESCSCVSMSYRGAVSSLAFHTSLFLKPSERSSSPYELTCPCNETH